MKQKHNNVSPDCSCGFYAYTTQAGFKSNRMQSGSRVDLMIVTGAISAYGNVFMGTCGYRAEKAKVIALVNVPEHCAALYPDAKEYSSELKMFRTILPRKQVSRTPDTDPDFWEKP